MFRSVVLVLSSVVAASCKTPSAGDRAGSSVALDAFIEPVAEVVEAGAPPLPPDLDVRALERQLGCPNRRHGRACRILHEFGQASHGMAQAPSGQGRFMGTAYRVEKGIEKAELVVLEAANVPASSVGPTDIPLRIAMGALPKDKRRDGGKLARALAHGEMPSQSNKALVFSKTWTSDKPGSERW